MNSLPNKHFSYQCKRLVYGLETRQFFVNLILYNVLEHIWKSASANVINGMVLKLIIAYFHLHEALNINYMKCILKQNHI